MTDTYTPQNFNTGYGWGQGYPSMYGTAPAAMPSPSAMPVMQSNATTAANAGVPPGAMTQQQLQQLQAAYGPPTAAPAAPGAQAPGQLTPQQLALMQYFLGGRSNTQQGQQQLLMQLLMRHGMLGQQQAGAT